VVVSHACGGKPGSGAAPALDAVEAGDEGELGGHVVLVGAQKAVPAGFDDLRSGTCGE
jgi:hypothetical protein